MKKKGLIISTAVMVVVLIAALTTGTFAWFSLTASASIDEMTLNTTAAQGLSIASVGNGFIASGTLSLSANEFKTGDNADYGNTISVTQAVTALTLYGVTGDGVTMKTAANGSDSVNAADSIKGGKPVKLVAATQNVSFIVVNIGIMNSKSGLSAGSQEKLFLKTFTVTGTGPMAAAARIALIPVDPDGGTATASATVGTTEAYGATASADLTKALYFIPYYNYARTGGTFKAGAAAALTDADIKYNTSDGSYSSSSTAKLGEGASSGAKIYKGTAAAIDTPITKWCLSSDATDATDAKVAVEDGTGAVELGSYSGTNQVIYYRLVIWFEGEDAQAVNANTGSGLKIAMEFGSASKEAA